MIYNLVMICICIFIINDMYFICAMSPLSPNLVVYQCGLMAAHIFGIWCLLF